MSDVLAAKSITLFFNMVCFGPDDWRRIGKPYRNKASAKEWLPFAVKSHRKNRGRVDAVVVPIVASGKTDKATQKLLSEKYNLDVDAIDDVHQPATDRGNVSPIRDSGDTKE